MENGDQPKFTIDDLATMIKTEFDSVRGEMRDGFTGARAAITAVDKRIDNLSYKVDQLDAKAEGYHQETKSDFASLRAIVGSQSHTLTDHEERIKLLEGE